MDKLIIWKALLKNIVDGLVSQGWSRTGGSDVFQLLHNQDDDCIKVFLDHYESPSQVLTRFSVSRRLEEIDNIELQERTKNCGSCSAIMLKEDQICSKCGEFTL